EGLDDTEHLLEVEGTVGSPGLGTVQGAVGQRRVDIQNYVDAGLAEDGNTLVVVQGRLDVVDTDGVDTQALHQSGVTHAGIAVGQRVTLGVDGVGTTGLVTVISQ